MSCESSSTEIQPDYFPDTHDPSGALQGPWRILVQLPTGVTMTSATVAAVEESGALLAFAANNIDGDSLVVTFDRVELATDVVESNVWGIYFFTQDGSERTYRIRGRYQKSDGTGKDKTVLLVSKQG